MVTSAGFEDRVGSELVQLMTQRKAYTLWVY